MKKLLIMIGVAVAAVSCDHKSEKKGAHHTDSPHADHAMDTTKEKGMQQLMSDMMTAMHQQKSTGNNDVDYAQMMMTHHQAAVQMAELQIQKGTNEPLKEFSRNIVRAQQSEIDSFQRILAVTSPVVSETPSDFYKASQASMTSMMQHEHHAEVDIDTDFVNLMIPHHQGAIDMAKAYLKSGTNIGLKNISQSIIQTQNKEIDWMHEWLKNKK